MSSLRTLTRCHRARGLIFVAALIPAMATHAAGTDFPSPTGGGPTPLLFLHPLVNYREDPRWIRQWERGLQSETTLRANVGSVSTDDFSTAVEVHVTEPISTRFRALYDLQWRESLHVEESQQQHFLGLEFAPFSSLGFQLQAHPASRKEEMDVRVGVLWHNAGREEYLRVLMRWDDFLFTEKNDRGGISEQVAASLEWTGRAEFGILELFSRGRYGSAARNSFPDSVHAPEVLENSGQRGYSLGRLRALATESRFIEFEVLHHEYEQSDTPRATGQAESYRDRIVDLALRGVWGFDTRWLVRAELHRLDQAAFGRGTNEFEYEREDWMPAVFVQWSPVTVHRFELGYLATSYEWNGSPDLNPPGEESGYVQKLKLGWLIEFSATARLQFSLSHEPDPQRFGGGNVQMLLLF
jgi:hypothetical protein